MDKTVLWRHPEMRDVAFEILRCTDIRGVGKSRIKVAWWNVVKSHPPYHMGIVQSFTVTNDWLLLLRKWE